MWIERLSDWLFRLEKVLAMILIGIMFVSLTAGVIFRYYLDRPLLWSDEVAIFSLIWLTFVGGSMSIKRQQAAAVSLLTDRLRGRWKKIVFIFGFAVVALFCLYLLYICYYWLSSPNIQIQRSSSLQLPLIYVYISVPIGFAFMFIHALSLFVKSFKQDPDSELN